MNIHDEALTALTRHLASEIDCLKQLLEILDLESVALRRLSLKDLDTLAPRKEKAVSRQSIMARRRAELMAACSPSNEPLTFTALLSALELDSNSLLVEYVHELRRIVADVVNINHRNKAFAQSGNSLVSGMVKIVDTFRSPKARTYARNGHLRSNLLEAIPRGLNPCSA